MITLEKDQLKQFLKGKTKGKFLYNIRILTLVKCAGETITYKEAAEFIDKEVAKNG